MTIEELIAMRLSPVNNPLHAWGAAMRAEEECKRALAGMRNAYPIRVAGGNMTKDEARVHINGMETAVTICGMVTSALKLRVPQGAGR